MSLLRIHQLLFALVIVVAGGVATLFDQGVLPVGILGSQAQYVLDVLCVVLCIVGTYVALRLLSFKRVQQSLQTTAGAGYYRWVGIRTFIVAVCIWSEVIVYFITPASQTAHYALFISLVAAVFCIPIQRERDGLIRKDEEA
ncbi:MAG: hypothetical protein IKH52_05145 [Bacteroidaceae bacterium]|nr:hypothetical protein [Bacteroidaceae bacterium]